MVNGSDFNALCASVYAENSLFGCQDDFKNEFDRRCRKIGDALMEEQGVTDCKDVKYSNMTIFGEKAAAAFQELNVWVKQQRSK